MAEPARVAHELHEPPDSVVELLTTYQISLEAATQGLPEAFQSRLLAALWARDAIARTLDAQTSSGPDIVATLLPLDEQLRTLAPKAEAAIGVGALKKLRSATAGRESQGWWWRLDEQLPGPSWPWTLLTTLVFFGAVGLMTEIAKRFFAEGPDAWGAFYILAQSGLTLAAGSTLVGAGGKWLERVLDDKGIRRRWHPWVKAGVAIVVLGVALGAYFGLLPWTAGIYSNAGVARAQEGNLSLAIQDFKHAVSLSPDFGEAHYNLGRAYERVLEYDSAAKEYQRAIEIERDLYPAYNSLARLYLVHKKDPSHALGLLDQGLMLTADDRRRPSEEVARDRFALLKNRGWANLEGGNLHQARWDLEQAKLVEPTRPSPYCLLAQLNEKLNIPAAEEWDLCLGYSYNAPDMEPMWLSMAQDRLRTREVRK